MIQSVSPEQYPELLATQIACIRGLGDTYTQHEIATWIGYLERATSGRFAAFENRASFGDNGNIEGFVSWTEDYASSSATIECLYVYKQFRGQAIALPGLYTDRL